MATDVIAKAHSERISVSDRASLRGLEHASGPSGGLLLLKQKLQCLNALFDGAALGDLVQRLVLLLDVMFIFVVNMHISTFNVSETYNQSAFLFT
jgi:hypothetical protein